MKKVLILCFLFIIFSCNKTYNFGDKEQTQEENENVVTLEEKLKNALPLKNAQVAYNDKRANIAIKSLFEFTDIHLRIIEQRAHLQANTISKDQKIWQSTTIIPNCKFSLNVKYKILEYYYNRIVCEDILKSICNVSR